MDAVASEVSGRGGLEIEEIIDQAATYEEFVDLLGDQIEDVGPDVMPPSVRVMAASEAALDSLEQWADDDARIYEVVDIREVTEGWYVAQQLDDELKELVAVTGGDMRSAVQDIRAENVRSLEEIVAMYRAVEEFVADECS